MPGFIKTWQSLHTQFWKKVEQGKRKVDFEVGWTSVTDWHQSNPDWRNSLARKKIDMKLTVKFPGSATSTGYRYPESILYQPIVDKDRLECLLPNDEPHRVHNTHIHRSYLNLNVTIHRALGTGN